MTQVKSVGCLNVVEIQMIYNSTSVGRSNLHHASGCRIVRRRGFQRGSAPFVEEGHEVIGLFMRNWNDESVTINNECPWIDDANDAMLVANHLGIPFQVMDLSVEYKERIVDYMFDEYAAGRTPTQTCSATVR